MFPKRIDVCQYGARMAAAQPIALPALGKVTLPVLDCTPLFSGAPLDEAAAMRLAAMLKVLGEPARLRLLSLIQAQPGHEACVCHLTEALDLSQPTVSHHLRVLFEAGLVDRERRGNWVYYRALPGALSAVLEALGGDGVQADRVSTSRANHCRCS
jgi:ArsR family transcriptional regulator, arsenate/arsenite/antimonite-responsive transcriptional repressor